MELHFWNFRKYFCSMKSSYNIRSLTPRDMVFLPDVHGLKWVNLNSKTDKIKLAQGSFALAFRLGTQGLGLLYLGLASPEEKPMVFWNLEFSDLNFPDMTPNCNLLLFAMGCFHLSKICAEL